VGRGSTSDRVSQAKGTASLDDDRVVEELVPPVQLRAVRDPFAEQHRHGADAHLIHQTEVECLLGDRRARDHQILITGDLPGRVIAASTPSTNVGDAEEASAGDKHTAAAGQPS
jgi:hypothetical protein